MVVRKRGLLISVKVDPGFSLRVPGQRGKGGVPRRGEIKIGAYVAFVPKHEEFLSACNKDKESE